MRTLPDSLQHHRVDGARSIDVVAGTVRFAPLKSVWFTAMALTAIVGGALTFTWTALALYLLHRVGLVWKLRLPEDLPARPELKPLRPAPAQQVACPWCPLGRLRAWCA